MRRKSIVSLPALLLLVLWPTFMVSFSGCSWLTENRFLLEIHGPKEVVAGNLTVFKARCRHDDVKYVWRILPPVGEEFTVTTGANDQQFAFSSVEKGTYHIVLVGLKSGVVEIATHSFINGDTYVPPPEPEPDPGPDPLPPEPEPDPPEPEPLPFLEALSKEVTALVKEKVPDSPERARISGRLGESMLSISSAIQAGAYDSKKIVTIREDTRKLNNDAVGWDNSEIWYEFSTALAVKIEKLVNENKLNDQKDYAVVWAAIGKGLKNVK